MEACDGGGVVGDMPRGGDSEGGGRCTRAALLIDVLDVNDNAPVFDKDVYTGTYWWAVERRKGVKLLLKLNERRLGRGIGDMRDISVCQLRFYLDFYSDIKLISTEEI